MNSIVNMLQVKFENSMVRDLYPDSVFAPYRSEDAGVDLHCPDELRVPAGARGFKIDLRIRCNMITMPVHKVSHDSGEIFERQVHRCKKLVPFLGMPDEPTISTSVPYQLWPRSSISKTPLRMSNSIGLIDKGYRGSIQFPVDNLSDGDYILEAGVRLCQIVSFNGGHIFLREVQTLSESVRGEGGFGSTGA